MIIEIASGSGTDQDIIPMGAPREGSDTSRELRPQPIHPSNSISIVLPNRTAMLAIAFGLLLVAAISVTVTWWLFTKDRHKGSTETLTRAAVQQSPAERAVAEPGERAQGGADAVEDRGTPPSNVVPFAGDGAVKGETDEAPVQAVFPDSSEPGPDAGGTLQDATDGAEASEKEPQESIESEGEDDLVVEEPDEPRPAPVAKATITVSALPGMIGYQIRIGSKTLTVPQARKLQKKLRPGRKKVAWRPNTNSAWMPALTPMVNLESGGSTRFIFTVKGPKQI